MATPDSRLPKRRAGFLQAAFRTRRRSSSELNNLVARAADGLRLRFIKDYSPPYAAGSTLTALRELRPSAV